MDVVFEVSEAVGGGEGGTGSASQACFSAITHCVFRGLDTMLYLVPRVRARCGIPY